QTDLYGRYARAALEPPLPSTIDDRAAWRDAGLGAVAAATGSIPGPVHVNAPFDEPLVPVSDVVPEPVTPTDATDVLPEHDPVAVRTDVDAFVARFGGRRGVILLGSLPPPTTLSLLSLGEILGWPVLAEPLSGLRGEAGRAGRALAAGQFLIGDRDWLAGHRPDVILQVGAAPTTRATQDLVADVQDLVVLDRIHLDPDPEGRSTHRIAVDPELFGAVAGDVYADGRPVGPDGWPGGGRRADLAAHAAIDRTLDRWSEPFEGRVARDLASFVPNGSILCVGSSSPVRDLDAYMAPRRAPRIWSQTDLVRVIGNRGASGIDGFVSTILGVAAADAGPTYALLGDLTLLHDAGGLLWSGHAGVDAVLVVASNGGGEIFSLLPQRE